MGLKDSLKRIEEQGRDATRRMLGQAREQWEDAERRVRASMRVHPRPKSQTGVPKNSVATGNTDTRLNSADPVLNEEMTKAQSAGAQQGGRSTSVSRRDVSKNNAA